MQIISISSLKGGVGKTSVTLGLASAARAAGIPTLVLDMDPHGDASTGLGVGARGSASPANLDIGSLLEKPRKAALKDHAVPSSWPVPPGEARPPVLDVVRGSARTSLFERPTTRRREVGRLGTLLEPVQGYDLVLIDCPPALNGVTRMAWAASTDVLLVAEPSLFSVAGTERTLRALDLFRSEYAQQVRTTGVVANRVRTDSAEHRFRLEEMERMFGDRLLPAFIAEQADWQQIQGAAWPVHAWPGEAATQTSAQFDELLYALHHGHHAPTGRRRRDS